MVTGGMMNEIAGSYEKSGDGVISRWLFNPFYYLAGGKALVIGVIVILITGVLACIGKIRFNGLLDFFMGIEAAPLWLNISEILISWLLLSILLLLFGKILSKSRIRLIDVFGTQALARFPYLFLPLVALPLGAGRFAQKILADPAAWQAFSLDLVIFLFLYLFIYAMLIWMVVLMYRAFSVSCNVFGKSAISLFVVALIVGEILSVIIIRFGVQALPAQTADFTSQASEFVTLLSEEEYESAFKMFDVTMTSAMPEEKLEEVWQSLVTQFGPFKAQGEVQKTEITVFDVYFVPCEFEKISLNSQIAFDREGKISGLYFRPLIGE